MQPSEEIKSRLDIVDLIREYVPLKPAGMNFRARCPFHREKTPSFMVSPDKQIWHCFGCGKGGDIFAFIMEIEGIDFAEALRTLAPKAGVTLRRQDPRLQSQRNRLLDITELCRGLYHKYLLDSPGAKNAREYLKSRGLSGETAEEWQIGYSPDQWDAVLAFLKGKGYTENEIFMAGMIVKSRERASFYDRFRGRIMFPINDINSNTVAFSARVSPEKEAEEKMGKYINSPQTLLYDKSKIIFGLDKAKLEIKKHDLAIVVEGQMDVISAHQAGFKNVVASSGTALTRDQILLLKRYSANIALAFDMDEAGEMALERGMRSAMAEEMNIKVIRLPQGKDPDECIRKDPEGWKRALKDAIPVMKYFFDKQLAKLDLANVDDKREGARLLLPVIARLGNKIDRDYWLRELSGRLDVKEEILREAIEKNTIRPTAEQETDNKIDKGEDTSTIREEKLSEILLALILKHFDLIIYSEKNLTPGQLVGKNNIELYRNLVFYYNSIIKDSNTDFEYESFNNWLIANNSEGDSNISNNIDNQLKTLEKLVFLADRDYFNLDQNSARNDIIKIIGDLKKRDVRMRLWEIEKMISEAEKAKKEDELKELLKEFKILADELREINN